MVVEVEPGGERAMVDLRSRAGTPRCAGVDLEALGGLVSEELHAVAALGQCETLRRQSLELDRSHLGAVLLALAAVLSLLVVVEFAELIAITGRSYRLQPNAKPSPAKINRPTT